MKIFTNIIFLTFVCFVQFECAEGSGRLDLNIPLDSDGEPKKAEPTNSHSPVSERSQSATSVFRERSRSPPLRPPSSHRLDKLGYNRFQPRLNLDRIFEFRRYVFPKDERIRRRAEKRFKLPMLSQEYIVLSTIDGEIFGIVENMETLKGIYNPQGKRVKVLMRDGKLERMTKQEVAEVSIDPRRKIENLFRVIPGKYDSLQHLYH